jgi:acid stress-induced BolA-like protein IbaG/YrbA
MEEEVIQALLAAGYSHDEIQLEMTPSGNIGGFVISRRFAGMTQLQRQDELWDQLRERITPETLRRIVSLLTMTPEETDDDVRSATG